MKMIPRFLGLSFNNKSKFIVLVTGLSLLLIPFIFWPSGTYVGGDDSRLYYLYPSEYLKNFATAYMNDNVVSSVGFYFPQFYILPFNLLLIATDYIFPNQLIQKLFFGLNLSLGFIAFFALQNFWLKSENWTSFYTKIICSLFYVLNPITMYSLWAQQLFSLYIVMLTPISLWLFIKGVTLNKKHYIILCSLITSVFSIVIVSAPWSLATLIVLLPFLVYYLRSHTRNFISGFVLFISLFIGLNFYWLAHIGYSLISNQQIDANNALSSLSQDFRSENAKGAANVIKYLDISYPLLSLSHHRLQKDFGWQTYPIFQQYHSKFVLFNIIFPIIIIRALYVLYDKRISIPIYKYILLTFLTALYFFVVNFLFFGPDLFVFLLTNVPGFALFRNMYDKFAYPFVLAYSLVLSISLTVLINSKSNYLKYTLRLFALAVFLGSIPLLNGAFFRLPIWKANNVFPIIESFNQEFIDLSRKIEKDSLNNKYLWYPLSSANYVSISDATDNKNIYLGVSPLLLLTGKNDFSGLLSFGQDSSKMHSIISNQDLNQFIRILQRYGITHIILNHEIPEEILAGFAYGEDFTKQQNEYFLSEILGDHITDFGSKYSLYKMKESLIMPALYLKNQQSGEVYKDAVSEINKISAVEYDFVVKNPDKNAILNFTAPYHSLWTISKQDNKQILASGNHLKNGAYGNSWLMSTLSNSSEVEFRARIKFDPNRLVVPAFQISFCFWILSLIMFFKFRYEK